MRRVCSVPPPPPPIPEEVVGSPDVDGGLGRGEAYRSRSRSRGRGELYRDREEGARSGSREEVEESGKADLYDLKPGVFGTSGEGFRKSIRWVMVPPPPPAREDVRAPPPPPAKRLKERSSGGSKNSDEVLISRERRFNPAARRPSLARREPGVFSALSALPPRRLCLLPVSIREPGG